MRPVFFDTNVIVYAFDGRDPQKQKIAKSLLEKFIAKGTAIISTQVIQEFCNIALRQQKNSLKFEDLSMVLKDVLFPILDHYPSRDYYLSALRTFQGQSLSYYDSLIVQAAIDAGCRTLYSEDLQHGQTIGGVKVTNPFVTS